MTINTSDVTAGSSLSISVSGTAYLQRSMKAGVMPGVLPQTDDEKAGSSGKETATQALAKLDAPTREAIEDALKKFDPTASLDTYAEGKAYSNNSGLMLHLIA